ncbi:type IV pilus assembly protein PilM [Allopseudospirillum japonicum]|uniref:Type IV pilus assembly protein PilM n=1 Tax=Allopseudospirillum japonicum TaxID=64971 RepID=A0A1H6R437_9GAMM|nr:pilus assembly protein PilM [Allopseudospirillum japonicum]SEI47984.1 type IV pilus assembly protein PilM [Allopseudospirillum japonicum]
MFSFLHKRSPNILGLDITSSAVKLLELGRDGQRFRVESYGVYPLPPDAVNERRIDDIDGVVKAISKVLERARPATRQVAVAVPGTSVITKTLTLRAHMSDDEVENQIMVEADQYIPFALDEVAMDFDRVRHLQEDNKEEILLVACRRDTTQRLDEVLVAAGLVPTIIDVETYAVERAFALIRHQLALETDEEEMVAIVDIGASVTTLSVMLNGEVLYSRDQMFGGKQLTDEIQNRYGITREEAGLAKKRGALPDDYESEILQPFREAVAQQIHRSLQLFFSSSQYNDVDYIVLAGGSAMVKGLVNEVQDYIGTPTLIANPFAAMSLGSKVNANALSSDAPALLIACGLALRSFD